MSGGDERVHAADCPLPRVQSKEKREPKFTSYSPPLPPYLITRLILIIKNFCRGVPEPQKNRRGVRNRVLVVHKAEVGGGVVWWLGAASQVVQMHRERLAWRRAGGRGGIS